MFSYKELDKSARRREIFININENPLLIKNPKIAISVSPIISKKIHELGINIEERQKPGESNSPIFNFKINEITVEQNSELIESIKILDHLFDGKCIKMTPQNHKILLVLARYFEMQSFIESLEEYEKFLNEIDGIIINSNELKFLIKFEELMMNLNEENLEKTAEECNEILHRMTKILFVYCLIRYFSLHYENSILYFSFLHKIDMMNGNEKIEDEESLLNIFFSFLKKSSVIKEKEINIELFTYYKNLLIHKLTKKENDQLNAEQPQKVDNSIINAIENDDADKLQTLLVQLNIDANQKIDEIIKNVFSLPRKYNLTFIKYAAFKGSIKCFKYLLINNAKIDQDDIALFAVAGGNNEIIRLCDQKGCNFSGTIKISIKNHYYSITEWLIENNKDTDCIGNEFYVKDPLKYCIKYCNFISLKYVISHSNNVLKLLTSSAKFNNEMLTQLAINVIKKYNFKCISLFEDEYCPISALHISCIRENIKTVKMILNSKLIDVNTKYGIFTLYIL